MNEQSGFYRDRGSKFLAFAFPVPEKSDFDLQMESIRKDHPKARHFCFAYILGPGKDVFRYSDDGEPSGSAGLPIYNQLRSFALHHVGVIVVRYFGGKKLGVPGLINAYKSSTENAINKSEVIEKYLTSSFRIIYDYEQTGPVMRALNETDLKIDTNGFEEKPFVDFTIRNSLVEDIKVKLFSLILNRDEADIRGDEMIEGFSIEEI